MAVSILGPSCAVERLGSATARREDMGRFRVFAWTSDPNLVPREKIRQIVEPRVLVDGDDDLMLASEDIIPEELQLLEYKVLIHLLQVDNQRELTDRTSSMDGPSNNGDSGNDGDPRRSYGGGRDARGARRNYFSCVRGQVDSDDFGNRPRRTGVGCRPRKAA